MDTRDNDIIKIDLRQVLKDKLGKKARFVPCFLVRWLEHTICQDKLNKLLADNYPRRGADFCRGVLDELGVSVTARDTDNLPPRDNRRVLIVSNHPLGGLDGMALIDFFTRHFGGKVYFLVNDLLMAVKPLNDVFIPINKHGAQSRDAARRLDEVLAGDDPVLIFPAGLCSRRLKHNKIADLEWKKTFVVKAIQSRRDIIPLFFDGKNSNFFYNFAHIRKISGIRFNIEMIYLPREIFRSRNKSFTLDILPAIPWQSLGNISDAKETALKIRTLIYNHASK